MRGRNRQEEDLRNQIQARENMMLKCAGNMEEHTLYSGYDGTERIVRRDNYAAGRELYKDN